MRWSPLDPVPLRPCGPADRSQPHAPEARPSAATAIVGRELADGVAVDLPSSTPGTNRMPSMVGLGRASKASTPAPEGHL